MNMWAKEDSPSFVEACLQSCIEPVEGKLYTMYHGTTKEAAENIKRCGFRQSDDGMLGRGVYVSRDINKANRYPLKCPEREKRVLKLMVNVGKVKKIDRQGHPMQKTWHDHGYDSAWVPPNCGMVQSGLEEDCIWDPDRIKVKEVMEPKNETCLQSYAEPVEGKLYTMYHGTTKERAESIKRCGFRQSPDGMLGQGVYVSRDFNKASRYPLNRPDKERRVLKLRVNVGKVKKIDCQGHPMQKTWHNHGYDSAWVPPGCGMVPSGLEEDCIWDPKRIKVKEVMEPKNETITAVSMWAEEDDSYSYEAPCLESYAQPQEWKCYTMYHGTTKKDAESITRYGFKQSEDGMLGRGVYVSRDFNKASRYPLHCPEREKRVLKLCVNVGRVKKIDRQKTWHHHGYDSAWVPPNCGMVASGLEEDCIWDPNRITVVEVIKPKNQGSVPRFDYMLPTEGKIYAMYHGTTVQAAASIKKYGFRQSTDGPLGRGVYLSRDKNKASCYPPGLPDSKKVVLKVRVNFGRIIKIDVASGHPLQKSWLDSGYHSAFISPSCSCRLEQSGLEEYCIWDPNRIKIVQSLCPVPQFTGGSVEYDDDDDDDKEEDSSGREDSDDDESSRGSDPEFDDGN
ncbi:hypothetical protein HHUSO_G34349 [Huso huso]|uniref:PARP catalytic domain-containing protein n=1 Tax=Huso huso TaxID=61971 RepID=A0ABR0Y6B9_HUSHU